MHEAEVKRCWYSCNRRGLGRLVVLSRNTGNFFKGPMTLHLKSKRNQITDLSESDQLSLLLSFYI